jgi:hypothetical protein
MPTVIFEDNMSTLALANIEQAECSDRTQHIDVRYDYTKQLIATSHIVLERIASKDQLADVFTKDLDKIKFRYIVDQVMNLLK